MVKTALVGLDIDAGARILQILDDEDLDIKVALWTYLGDYEDWRIVLASRHFDAAGLPASYGLLHKALAKAGISVEETPSVVILRMTDPFIKSLRKSFGKTRGTDGMRLGLQSVGNRFLEDSYVYRIS